MELVWYAWHFSILNTFLHQTLNSQMANWISWLSCNCKTRGDIIWRCCLHDIGIFMGILTWEFLYWSRPRLNIVLAHIWRINYFYGPHCTASFPKSYPVCALGCGNQTWLAGRSMTISELTLSQLTQNTRTNTHISWHQYEHTTLMSYRHYISLL